MSGFGSFHKRTIPPARFVGLSLRQPWAWAVLHLGKVIENRRWCTDYRGPILLHAAKGMKREEYDDCEDTCAEVFGSYCGDYLPPFESLARGGFVGRARITGVVRPRPGRLPISGDLRDHYPPELREHRLVVREAGKPLSVEPWRWHFSDQYGFILADIEPMPFVPYAGCLGLFSVPYDPWATPANDTAGAP